MRALVATSLIALGLAVGCSPKVVVVKEPTTNSTEQHPQQVDPAGNPIATDDPRASDPNGEPDWGIKDPSDSQEYALSLIHI